MRKKKRKYKRKRKQIPVKQEYERVLDYKKILVVLILGIGFIIFLANMGAFSSPLGFLGGVATTAIVGGFILEARAK
jgi:preprotein translocase subunit Sss1|tara:strand:+ start:223 stop:453 length:231 start_codon:yes stop_codon:yes gene_type:complete